MPARKLAVTVALSLTSNVSVPQPAAALASFRPHMAECCIANDEDARSSVDGSDLIIMRSRGQFTEKD